LREIEDDDEEEDDKETKLGALDDEDLTNPGL